MKRQYFIFSNGRLLRRDNTIYLHQYAEEREDGDEISLEDAAEQNGCVLEDLEIDNGEVNSKGGAINDPSGEDFAAIADQVLDVADKNAEDAPLNAESSASSTEDQRAVLHKRPIPVHDIEALYLFGEMDINTKLLNFAARHKIPIHVFNYFGFYSGTFYGREEVNSGFLLVKQVEHYSSLHKRLQIARAFVEGASFNILKNLKYYGAASRGRDLSAFIERVETERLKIATARDINTLMGVEGAIRATYYAAWPLILSAPWAEFTKRVKRPPDNPVNALVSFGNSLCYTLALGEIYRTPLSPLISFLHEPGARRYSLSLDLAEIFKPILCDRIIFKLINNGELTQKHFDEKLNFCYLKESGRKIFLQEWDERLKQTIEHRNLGRKVSYRRLVRLECYRLEKHVMGIKDYEPFKIWW